MDTQPKRNEDLLEFRSKTGCPVICTAGRSYYVIRGDGKIYRCLYNPQVLGNIQDATLPQLDGGGLVCHHKNNHSKLDDSCHPSGDLMFATFWENQIKNEAPWPWWHEDNDPRKAKSDAAYFIVLPVMSKCNLACPYCCNFYFEEEDGTTVGRPKDHDKDMPLEAFVNFANAASKKLKWAHFGFLGGEPTLYKPLPELVDHLVNVLNWEVGICSNMMITNCFRKIAESVKGTGREHLVKISASLHPSSPRFDWSKYLSSCIACKEAGLDVRGTLVSWSEQTYMFEHYRDELAKYGVTLTLKGCGGYDHKADQNYVAAHGGHRQTYEVLQEIDWIPRDGAKPNVPPGPKIGE